MGRESQEEWVISEAVEIEKCGVKCRIGGFGFQEQASNEESQGR